MRGLLLSERRGSERRGRRREGREEEGEGREGRGGLSGNVAEEAFCLKSPLRRVEVIVGMTVEIIIHIRIAQNTKLC